MRERIEASKLRKGDVIDWNPGGTLDGDWRTVTEVEGRKNPYVTIRAGGSFKHLPGYYRVVRRV